MLRRRSNRKRPKLLGGKRRRKRELTKSDLPLPEKSEKRKRLPIWKGYESNESEKRKPNNVVALSDPRLLPCPRLHLQVEPGEHEQFKPRARLRLLHGPHRKPNPHLDMFLRVRERQTRVPLLLLGLLGVAAVAVAVGVKGKGSKKLRIVGQGLLEEVHLPFPTRMVFNLFVRDQQLQVGLIVLQQLAIASFDITRWLVLDI